MKLIIIIGSGAVGKMTVGQALADITDLRLFHNHMTIEPVIEIFGHYDARIVERLRQVIFDEVVVSDIPGLIFTVIWAFNQASDWDYIQRLVDLFESHQHEVYFVELIAPQEIRLARNRTDNRLKHKPSKRDITFSQERLLHEEAVYRLISHEGEITYPNYLRIDNSHLSPQETARRIQETFDL